jgi:DNA-binding response OmpR family regulator
MLRRCRKAKGIDDAHRASIIPSTGVTAVQAKVIIVGADPAMGRSLEALLQAAGYDARFQPEPLADRLDELLVDSRLLLVAPGLSTESGNALTDVVIRTATKIPILELLPANGGEAVGIQGADAVPWPCPLEELKQRIQAALLAQG